MQKLLSESDRTRTHIIKVIEGFETVTFKSKFKEWPQTPELKLSSEDGRGKVAGYYLQIYQLQFSAFKIYEMLYTLHNLINCVLCEALLKRQGLNVKGLMKAAPAKEEPQSYIDCTGNLQVFLHFLYQLHILYLIIFWLSPFSMLGFKHSYLSCLTRFCTYENIFGQALLQIVVSERAYVLAWVYKPVGANQLEIHF